MMALETHSNKHTQHGVYVVQFSEFKPYEHIDKYVCVPSSWIISRKSSKGRVLVAYPFENPKQTKERVRLGENFSTSWPKIWADPVHKFDNYNKATLWIVANYKNKRNEERNNINETQTKSVASEADQNVTKLPEAIKRPVVSDPRLELSVNPQKRPRLDPKSELSQRSNSLEDSRSTAVYNTQSVSLQSATKDTTSNMQTIAKSPSKFGHSSASSHQQRISAVSNTFLMGDRRKQVALVDSSGVNSISITVPNYSKQAPKNIISGTKYQTNQNSSGSAQPYTIPIQETSTSTNSLGQVIARPDKSSTEFETSLSNTEYAGNAVQLLQGAQHRNSIETNTHNGGNSFTDMNIKELLLEILKKFNHQTPQIIPNNTTSVLQNPQASVSISASESISTENNTATKSSIQNSLKTEIQSSDVPIEFSPYSNQELFSYNNEQSTCLENIQHNRMAMHDVLNKVNALHDNIIERVKHVETLVVARTSKNQRKNNNKRNIKREIIINSSDDNDDDDSTSSTSADQDVKFDKMEFDGEYCEDQKKNFTLPPEYTQNDSKRTLQHQMVRPGVVELKPQSGVFVDAIQLGNCLKEASDSKILAQMLLTAIFTPKSLRVCSLPNVNVNSRTNVRPELDKHAINELLRFVESYRRYKRWTSYNSLAINHALQCKMYEFRSNKNHENTIEAS